MRRTVMTAAMVMLGWAAAAQAQTPATVMPDHEIVVAPFVGFILDTPEDWFLIGGEARFKPSGLKFEINPRLTFNPFEGGSMVQLDVNLIHNYPVEAGSKLRPYVGIGGAFNRFNFGPNFSDSAVGLNLLSGARYTMKPDSRFEPFVNFQYTIIRGQGNLFTIVAGATFKVR